MAKRNPNNPSIYLNEARRSGLDKIAKSRRRLQERKDATGKPYQIEIIPTQQDLVKEAIDEFLERHLSAKTEAQLQAPAKG